MAPWLYSCRFHQRIGKKMIISFADFGFFRWKIGHSVISKKQTKYFSSAAVIFCNSSSRSANFHPEIEPLKTSGSLPNLSKDILPWLMKYQQAVYQSLNIPFNNSNSFSCSILHNYVLKDDLINLSHRHPEFEKLMQFLADNINTIALGEVPMILHCLVYLYVPCDKTVVVKLFERCVDNLNSFDIHQLALFSQCAFMTGQTDPCLKIVEHVHTLLRSRSIPHSSSPLDLSVLFQCLGHFMSRRMLNSCVEFVLEYISRKSVIDMPSLGLLCKLVEGSREEVKEILQRRILQSGIPTLSGSFDLQEIDVERCCVIGRHLDSLFGHTSLASEIRRFCVSEITRGAELTPEEILKLAFFLPSRRTSFQFPCSNFKQMKFWSNEKFADGLLNYIRKSDSQGLLMVLKLFRHTKLPWDILLELHDGFMNSLEERLFEELDDESFITLYHLVQTLMSKGFQVSDKLVAAVSKQGCNEHHTFSVSKGRAVIAIHSLLSTLWSNEPHRNQQTELFLSLSNQLDISSLMFLSIKLDMAAKKIVPTPSSRVRSQMGHLVRHSRQCLRDKISSLHLLPVNSLPSDLDDVWAVSRTAFIQSGVLQTLVTHLEHLTQQPAEEVEWLRAFEILSMAASHVPLHKPVLFENLLHFIYACDPVPERQFLALIQCMSSAAYRPNDFGRFATFCLAYQRDVRLRKSLSLTQQVQLVHCLSVYGLHDEQVLLSLFSSPFLTALEEEMEDMKCLHGRDVAFYDNCLKMVNRYIIVECPHLRVSPRPGFSDVAGRTSPEFFQSIQRIFDNSPHIRERTQSNLGHRIDALVCLGGNGEVIDPKTADFDKCHKLAFLYLSSVDLCHKVKRRPTGHIVVAVRQLKRLGFFVVEIPYHRLYAMDMHSDEGRDNFFRDQILHAIGPHFLFN